MQIERITAIVDQVNGLNLSEIRDIINGKQGEVQISNKEVKLFLIEQLEDSIHYFPSKNENESLLVFSSKLNTQDIVQIVKSTDVIKSAASSLRLAIREVSFDLDDKFCDADDLETSWKKTPEISNKFMTYFSTLCWLTQFSMKPIYRYLILLRMTLIQKEKMRT